MGSKFGFGNIKIDEREFLTQGINLAKQEFESNFDSESNAETGQQWNRVERNTSDPILNVTGQLKSSATRNGGVEISGNSASFEISSIDGRGKQYASFHQDGENQYKSKEEFQREYVTQSEDLENKQINLLLNILDKSFR